MTVLDRTTVTTRVTMDSLRKTALIAGLCYLISFVSIPTLLLYTAVHEPNFIVGPGPDTPVLIGGVLEMIVALAGLGSAVALYPIVKRQNQGMALGLVGTRTIEGAGILVGVACLLTVVTLRQAGVGPEGLVTGQALVGLYDRLFLLSQSTMPAFNALMLAPLLYWSRLVPRVLPTVGLIAAPLLLTGTAAVLFGVIERGSPLQLVLGIPIALWEFSLGVYLAVKGFKPSPSPPEWSPRTRGPPTRTRACDEPPTRTALVAGALYLITFATSIPARVLFAPVRNDPNYILGPGVADRQVLFAGLLDVLLAFACIGTAIALYPVVKRQNQGVALGFVGSRTLEAAIIVTGVVALVSVVTLRQAGAGADALGASHALVAMYNWKFLFGPGFMAVVNACLLGSLMYRFGLVPRIIPLVGLIGAPVLFASDLAVLFGLWTQTSLPAGIATVPSASALRTDRVLLERRPVQGCVRGLRRRRGPAGGVGGRPPPPRLPGHQRGCGPAVGLPRCPARPDIHPAHRCGRARLAAGR